MAHILVVDDDELERTFAGRVMEAGQHTVVFAVDGQAAIDLYAQGGVDVVVLVRLGARREQQGGREGERHGAHGASFGGGRALY